MGQVVRLIYEEVSALSAKIEDNIISVIKNSGRICTLELNCGSLIVRKPSGDDVALHGIHRKIPTSAVSSTLLHDFISATSGKMPEYMAGILELATKGIREATVHLVLKEKISDLYLNILYHIFSHKYNVPFIVSCEKSPILTYGVHQPIHVPQDEEQCELFWTEKFAGISIC